MTNKSPTILRSVALGVTIGAGACGVIFLLSGCATKTAYTVQPPAMPPAPQRVFLSAFDAQARSMATGAPQMALVAAQAAPVFVSAQSSLTKRGTLSLAWDASPDASVTGYRLHYGTNSGSYQFSADVGSSTNANLTGLDEGRTYYVAATAYDSTGTESDFSNEVVGLTAFSVTLRQQCWEVSAWGRFGVTNWMQMSTNLIDWENVMEWIGTGSPANYLHTNSTHSWFRVEAMP